MSATTTAWKDKKAATKRNKAIDKSTTVERRERGSNADVLILGYDRDIMRTFLHTMKLAHGGYNAIEMESYRHTTLLNTMGFMCSLIFSLISRNIPLSPELISWYEKLRSGFRSLPKTATCLDISNESVMGLRKLWQDPTIKAAANCGIEHGLNENAIQCLKSIDALTHNDYTPTEDDIIRYCTQTPGIVEMHFHHRDTNYRMLDVGERKGDNRKLWPCFQDVPVVVFCVDLANYDKVDPTDGTNEITRSIRMFNSICESIWFRQASIILLLKTTELPVKIASSPLVHYFPDYEAGDEPTAASLFLRNKFYGPSQKSHEGAILTQLVQEKDTMRLVIMNSIHEALLHWRLRVCGLLKNREPSSPKEFFAKRRSNSGSSGDLWVEKYNLLH